MSVIAERCLEYLTGVDYSDAPALRHAVNEFLAGQIGCNELEFWSKVYDEDAPDLYTNIMFSKNGQIQPAEQSFVLETEQLQARLAGFEIVRAIVPLPNVAGLLPPAVHCFAFKREGELSIEDMALLEKTLTKISRDTLRGQVRRINELLISLLPPSKDLASYLHRVIRSLLLPAFEFEHASIFFHETKTDSLVLAATTGIQRAATFGLKKSDIRYFADGKSYTSACYRTAHEIVENVYKSRPLRRNAQGEPAEQLHSRLYLPIRRWGASGDEKVPQPLGVIRALNVNADNSYHPITVVELARMRVVASAIAGVAEKYMRALSISVDQERATHGYTTDLLTIKYAAENIGRWITVVEGKKSPAALETAVQEVVFRVGDIIAVQENMASQLLTVTHHNQHARLPPQAPDQSFCSQPYTDVFMRLLKSKKGISDCYGRPELRITYGGHATADEPFTRMPAIDLTVGTLYLAIRNIAENAIKYSQKSERPKIDLSWRIDGAMAEFRFRDFGIGVPEADRELIGREAFRGRRAQELQLRGNGLGLSTVISVLSSARASLQYEPPADGPGSVFVLRVPIKKTTGG